MMKSTTEIIFSNGSGQWCVVPRSRWLSTRIELNSTDWLIEHFNQWKVSAQRYIASFSLKRLQRNPQSMGGWQKETLLNFLTLFASSYTVAQISSLSCWIPQSTAADIVSTTRIPQYSAVQIASESCNTSLYLWFPMHVCTINIYWALNSLFQL